MVAATFMTVALHVPYHLARSIPRGFEEFLVDNHHDFQVICAFVFRVVIKSRSTTNRPIFECSLSISASTFFAPAPSSLPNPSAIFLIAARFQPLIMLGCTPVHLRQFRQRQLPADFLQCHTRLKIARIPFFLRHFLPSFS